jgi:1-acyl-sn-glycerol-3-phosphate acyltransferase
MGRMSAAEASRGLRFRHALQREVGRLAAPFWLIFAGGYLRFVRRYRVVGVRESRKQFRRIRASSDTPILICANHLTLIDSLIIAWALASSWRSALNWSLLPWNTPERKNFALTRPQRVAVYLAKCIPITRGGAREEVGDALKQLAYLTTRGELALIFPEGGRSRTGRVELETAAWGVGRIVSSVPNCRVVCVYLRGLGQQAYSDLPAKGERFHIEISCIEPKSDARGVRRSRDLSRQIVAQLARMEEHYFESSGGEHAAEETGRDGDVDI